LGDGQIEVNGRSFKGSMEIIGESGGTLTVVNELPLEDYVMGVLAGEIPREWPLEALKAQAIAARTFAVFQRDMARKKDEPYDLESTAQFQIYQGSGLVNEKIQQAVLETQGRIATYNSEPIMAFFHSNCGGNTCGAVDVWSQDEPYLKSVNCPFGNNGVHFRWRAEIPTRDLVRQLRSAGIEIGDIVRLDPLEEDDSNHILKLALMDSDGTRKTIRGTVFRKVAGPDVIRSTRFTAKVGPNKVIFVGKGWGHGVGLCQEGACGMALKGYNAFEILRYYYHGIAIEKMRNDPRLTSFDAH
jgi:stage II sporulation protein D